ncbi:hypothetical protein [Chryseobacterium sp.]|uniref:hypothetical protein n=1 Tax=Chryseobacterium sp. TaxID=1871047 RepID=UPI002FCC015C
MELKDCGKRLVYSEKMPVVVEYIFGDYNRTLKTVIVSFSTWEEIAENIRKDFFA